MIKAKKRFGQNFLKDSFVLDKIIEAMPKNSNDLIEIGPGLGDLTSRLLKIKDVTAYEIDSDLYAVLSDKFKTQIEQDRLKIVLLDVLDIWEKKGSLSNNSYDIVANLPYYIATSIILKGFDDVNCQNMVVMVQKEVAKKFSAKVGNKDFSSLSVLSNLMCDDVKILTDVPPTSFEPVPKVYSSVILFKKNGKTLSKGFKNFLKIAFSSPRKRLLKNLSLNFDKNKLQTIFKNLDIPETIRPHQVSSSSYHLIFESLK